MTNLRISDPLTLRPSTAMSYNRASVAGLFQVVFTLAEGLDSLAASPLVVLRTDRRRPAVLRRD